MLKIFLSHVLLQYCNMIQSYIQYYCVIMILILFLYSPTKAYQSCSSPDLSVLNPNGQKLLDYVFEKQWTFLNNGNDSGMKILRANDDLYIRPGNGFKIIENGDFIEYMLSPNDILIDRKGCWTVDKEMNDSDTNIITVKFPDNTSGHIELESYANNILKVKIGLPVTS